MLLQITGGFSQDLFDEPMFQLGTWCMADTVRPVQTASDLDATGDVDIERESDRLISIIETLVYPTLNDIHGLNYCPTFWRHTVGTYFRMLVPLLVHRHNLVKRTRDVIGLKKYTHLEVSLDTVIPDDRPSMLHIINSHAWNQVIISSICQSLGLTPVTPATAVSLPSPIRDASRRLHREAKGVIKRTLVAVCNAVAKRSPVLISRSMLPKRTELKLAIKHRTLPFSWTEDFEFCNTPDPSLRKRVQQSIPPIDDAMDETIIRLAISQIPKVFIEDFTAALGYAKERLPRTPDCVFTANLHQASDVFLIWLCDARISGTKIMIAQHGGVHSLCRDIPADIEMERDIADRYITWGAPTFSSRGTISGPVLVNVGARHRIIRQPQLDSVLLVLDSPYRYPSVPRGMNADRFHYAALLNELIRQLDPAVVTSIEIRPYRGAELWDDSLTDLLVDDIRLRRDDRFPPIQNLYDRSKLVVCTSLGTTFFQTIHQNIPTMIFLDHAMSPVSTEASVALSGLRQASILFDDIRKLSTQINRHYESINSWWTNETTRGGIDDFWKRVSPDIANPISFYGNIITSTRSLRSKA